LTILYPDGRSVSGVILSQTENSVRVAVEGGDEVVDVYRVNGYWITSDCDPVDIEFAWHSRTVPEVVSETDCICSQDLASHLMHLLQEAARDDEDELGAPVRVQRTAARHLIV